MAARRDGKRVGSNGMGATDIVRGVANHPDLPRGEVDPMELAGLAEAVVPQLVAALAVVAERPEWEIVPKTVVAKLYLSRSPRIAGQEALGDCPARESPIKKGPHPGEYPRARLCHLARQDVQIGRHVVAKIYFIFGQVAPGKNLAYNPAICAAGVLNPLRDNRDTKDTTQSMAQGPQAGAARSDESSIDVPKKQK